MGEVDVADIAAGLWTGVFSPGVWKEGGLLSGLELAFAGGAKSSLRAIGLQGAMVSFKRAGEVLRDRRGSVVEVRCIKKFARADVVLACCVFTSINGERALRHALLHHTTIITHITILNIVDYINATGCQIPIERPLPRSSNSQSNGSVAQTAPL